MTPSLDTLGVRQIGGEVVYEDMGRSVLRIAFLIGAQVAGTQVTLRVIAGPVRRRARFDAALPRSLGAVRRNEDPFAGQGVEPAVRLIEEIETHIHFEPLISASLHGW
jgi:hypothetical protein